MKKYILLAITLLASMSMWAQDEVDETTLNNPSYLTDKDNTNLTASFYVYDTSLTFTSTKVKVPGTITDGDVTYNIIKVKNLCFNNSLALDILLPDGVLEVCPEGYGYVNGVKSITLSKTVATVNNLCNNSIREFKVAEDNPYFSVDDYGVLFNKDKTKLIYAPYGSHNESAFVRYEIPASVKEIGNYAFYYFNSTDRITCLGNQLETIGEYAFYGCSELLKFVSTNEALVTIKQHAFHDCNKLNTFTFTNSIQTIEYEAFYYADLDNSEFILPTGLKKLSEGAFCYAFHDNYLSKLVFPSELNDNLTISGFENSVFRWTNVYDVYSYIQDPKPISSIFNSAPNHIYIPKGSLDNYKNTAGWNNWSDQYVETANMLPEGQKAGVPTFSLSSDGTTLSISSSADASIYYTTDGTEATSSSTPYTGPISLTQNMTVNAIAVETGKESTTGSYVVNWFTLDDVTITPYVGSDGSTIFVKMSTNVAGATIKYIKGTSYQWDVSHNVSDFEANGIVYDDNDRPSVQNDYWIYAYATRDGFNPSGVTSTQCTTGEIRCNTPVIDKNTKEDGSIVITMTCSTDGATIYYTTGSSDTPTRENGTIYTGPISVTANYTYKAIAVKEGFLDSYQSNTVSESSFTATQPNVTIIASYTESGAEQMKAVVTGSGDTREKLWYRIGGSGEFLAYSAPVTVNNDEYFQAYASIDNWNNSSTWSNWIYKSTYRCSTPTFTGDKENLQVIIACETAGSTIYYTVDGTTPTKESPVYTAPITLTRNCTVKAFAAKDGLFDSNKDNNYTANNWFRCDNVTAKLVIDNGLPKVELSCTTPDVTIRYGINTTYEGDLKDYQNAPIEANQGNYVYAIARRDGYLESENWTSFEVTYAGYTQCSMPYFSLDDATHTVTLSTLEENGVIYYTLDGTTPTQASTKYTEPFVPEDYCVIKAVTAKDEKLNSDVSMVELTEWFRLENVEFDYLLGDDEDSYAVKLSHPVEGTTIRYYVDTRYYSDSSKPTTVYEAGTSIPVTLGQYVHAVASKPGRIESNWNDIYIRTDNYKVSNPSIEQNNETKVLIVTTTTKDATIYYTIDGTDPTDESTKLEGSELKTVVNGKYKFIAVKDHMNSSDVVYRDVDWFRVPNVTITPFAEDNIMKVRLECKDEEGNPVSGAAIYYAVNDDYDSEYLPANTAYTEPFEIADGTRVYASAQKEGYNNAYWTNSGWIYKTSYTATMPSITIAADTTVTISSTEEGSVLYYTLDGSDPTTSSTKFTSKFKMTTNGTIKAIAAVAGKLNSGIRSRDYSGYSVKSITITPIVENNKLKIKLESETPGAKLYYGINEYNSSTIEANLPYSVPFEIPNDSYVYAIGTKEGYTNSGWSSNGWYYYSSYTCEQPTITITADTTCIMSASEGASIYYTMNGDDPTNSNTLYTNGTSGFKLTSNVTIKAIAVQSGMMNSSIRERSYSNFRVASPVITNDGAKITITSDTPGVTFKYCYDPDPRDENGNLMYSRTYTGPFEALYNSTIYVQATKDGFNSSNSNFWISNVVKCKPVEQVSYNGHSMKLKAEEGTTIWYTVNGETPNDNTNGWYSNVYQYVDSIKINNTGKIRAIATAQYKNQSDVSDFEVTSFAGETGATTEKAGGLAASMGWSTPSDITEFTITGPINASDISFVKNKMTSLEKLDLSNATIDDGNLPDNAFADMPLLTFSSPNGLKSVGDNIFTGCDNLAAVVWNTTAKIPDNAFDADVNPNLLLFVPSEEAAPTNSSAQNIIVNGTAKNIYLSDGEGNNFHCPQGFYAQNITYTHNFKLESGDGYGWETIALPFECSRFIHESKGELLPFAAYDSLTEKGMYKPFWLRELTDVGFKDVSRIEANKPYIISMPNNDGYASRYRLGGKVTFTSTDTWVPVTEPQAVQKGVNTLYANFLNDDSTDDIMLLNTVETDGKKAGSIFVKRSGRALRPFEAYVVSRSNARAAISISRGFSDDPDGDDDTTPIETVNQQTTGKMVKVYTLSGVLVKEAAEEDALKGLAKGVYIVNGKSMIVK